MINGIINTIGILYCPRAYSIGRVAIVPAVPGAIGQKPTPKKDKKITSIFLRLGALLFFIK